MKKETKNSEWLTVEGAAKQLECEPSIVQALITGLPAAYHEIRKTYIIHSDDLQDYISKIVLINSLRKKSRPNQKKSVSERECKRKRPEGVLTGREVDERLGFPLGKTKEYVKSGEMPGMIHGPGCYVKVEDVASYAKSHGIDLILVGNKKNLDSVVVPPENQGGLPEDTSPALDHNMPSEKVKNLGLAGSEIVKLAPSLESSSDVNPETKTVSIRVKKGPNGQKICTVGDVAEAVHISVISIEQWIKAKKVVSILVPVNGDDRSGREEKCITLESLTKFLKEQRNTEVMTIERVNVSSLSRIIR
jgi:hypothetical protein